MQSDSLKSLEIDKIGSSLGGGVSGELREMELSLGNSLHFDGRSAHRRSATLMSVSRLTFGLSLALAQWAVAYGSPQIPSSVREASSRSVVIVEIFKDGSAPVGHGSGVVIAPHVVVTNCHVLAAGTRYSVLYRDALHVAEGLKADERRDLCSLSVPSLKGVPVRLGTTEGLKDGERVFSIGAPKARRLVINAGVVQALRLTQNGSYIRSSAHAAPGSSGGGLFTVGGELVGIITMGPESYATRSAGTATTFAQPVEWIRELEQRSVRVADLGGSTPVDVDRLLRSIRAQGRWITLLRASERWLSDAPEYPVSWIAMENKARALEGLGRFDEAIETLRRVLTIEPLASSAWNNLGNLLGKRGDMQGAIVALERAAELELDPRQASISYFNLGVLHGRIGDTSEKQRAYGNAVRLDPTDAEAQRNLGVAWIELGELEKGIGALRQATSLMPRDEQAWLALCVAQHLAGNIPSRDAALSKLQQLNPAMAARFRASIKAE